MATSRDGPCERPKQVIEACDRDERCRRDTTKEPTDKLLIR